MKKFKKINHFTEKENSIYQELRHTLADKSYFIHTYGCQLNENDSEKICGILDSTGMYETDDHNTADVIVFNTCTIRENANDKFFGNLGIIKKQKSLRPDIIVMVCGCMMKESHNIERIKDKFSFVDIIFGPSDIYRLPELLEQRIKTGEMVSSVGPDDNIAEDIPVSHKKRFRALVTIIYGCNNFCSYCIVPYVRGRERSRDPQDILGELRKLAEEGYPEVMLLGQNVNSYGKDFDGYDFSDLLKDASEIEGISRIRFMTSHPKDISRKLIDTMVSSERIMPHLHLPVQSGSDNILKKMNRGYSSGQYMDIVTYARSVMPDISITTDIIVGFPGESEVDFMKTLNLMGEVRFDSAFTFIFSPRKGTPAATFTDQVSEEVKKERFNRLIELQNKCSLESNIKTIGTIQEVLVEGISHNKSDALTGRTRHNKLVNFKFDDVLYNEGDIVNVEITDAKTFSLEGKVIKNSNLLAGKNEY